MTRYGWLMVVVAACGGGKEPADDDTPTTDDTDVGGDDTDVTGGDDTDVTGGDDTDVTGGDDTDAGGDDTDAAGDDTDPPGDTTAPVIAILQASDYTVFFDRFTLNIYWRDAADETTAQQALEYRVTCQPDGVAAGVVLDWTRADALATEGSGRYWFVACGGPPGYYNMWVSVRDEAGNVAEYPTLQGQIYSSL
jgi:hypothetical protein